MIPSLLPHSALTAGVTVRVGVSFLPDQSQPAFGKWFWSYHIRIENGRADTIQLLTRHWLITDGMGRRAEVKGDGVVGEQPVIAPGGTHDYVSGCPLGTPTGSMAGHFGMIDAAGEPFTIAIPGFALRAPATAP